VQGVGMSVCKKSGAFPETRKAQEHCDQIPYTEFYPVADTRCISD